MTFSEYSKNSKKLIEENLIKFFNEKEQEKIPSSFKDQNILMLLEEFVLRGKLIRGTLFLLSLEMMGEKISNEHISIACAIELVHSALLIQDDIIDNDRTRRGHDTIFVDYERRGEEINAISPLHYGISMGLVSADVAIFLAMELLSDGNKEYINALLKFYAHEIYLVSAAQGVDSEFGQSEKEPSKDEIFEIYKYKTARYTFSLPFVMAGIVCNNENNAETLEELGEIVGIIFQIKDDIIGFFGDEETIGKPVGSDIRENKKTLIRSLLYKSANDDEKKALDSAFGNKNLSFQQIEDVKKLSGKYEILQSLDLEINRIMEKAWGLFEKLEFSNEYKDTLRDLLEFNLSRSY